MTGSNLHKDRLSAPESVMVLGAIVAQTLAERGAAVLFINQVGEVETCPLEEVVLDALPETEALGQLLDTGYTDDQLMAYLRGRAAREGLEKLRGTGM